MARLTTIRCSQGPKGRLRSKRSMLRMAARKASCAMSSAAEASWTTRYAARYDEGQYARKRASKSEAFPACAPRIQARSSPLGPAIARTRYDRRGPGGPRDEYVRGTLEGPAGVESEKAKEGADALASDHASDHRRSCRGRRSRRRHRRRPD